MALHVVRKSRPHQPVAPWLLVVSVCRQNIEEENDAADTPMSEKYRFPPGILVEIYVDQEFHDRIGGERHTMQVAGEGTLSVCLLYYWDYGEPFHLRRMALAD